MSKLAQKKAEIAKANLLRFTAMVTTSEELYAGVAAVAETLVPDTATLGHNSSAFDDVAEAMETAGTIENVLHFVQREATLAQGAGELSKQADLRAMIAAAQGFVNLKFKTGTGDTETPQEKRFLETLARNPKTRAVTRSRFRRYALAASHGALMPIVRRAYVEYKAPTRTAKDSLQNVVDKLLTAGKIAAKAAGRPRELIAPSDSAFANVLRLEVKPELSKEERKAAQEKAAQEAKANAEAALAKQPLPDFAASVADQIAHKIKLNGGDFDKALDNAMKQIRKQVRAALFPAPTPTERDAIKQDDAAE